MKNPEEIDFLQEETFQDLFDNAHDLVHITNLDGNIVYVNNSWLKVLGFSLEEIRNRPVFSLIDEKDLEQFKEYRAAVIDGKIQSSEIIVTINGNHNRKIVVEGIVTLKKKDGKPYYTRGIFKDVTLKLQNEAQLREREFNLQQLLINAPDAIVVINSESAITYWNPKAEDLFGWTAEEVLNQQLSSKIVPQEFKAAHDAGLKRYMETGVAHVINKTVEITAVNKQGKEFFISLTISRTTHNGQNAFIAFIRDIDEQKKNEFELKKKTEELEVSNQQLEHFAHVASHDMKEPIRKITVFSQLLESELGDNLNEGAKNYLSKIKSATDRLQNMVEGVLKYATVFSVEQEEEAVDLNLVIRNIETDLEIIIRQKKAIIQYSTLPVIKAIDFLIYQLLYNLINNSLKFSKEGEVPVINIASREIRGEEALNAPKELHQQKFLEITIKDNGIGFNPTYATDIFKTFTRLNNRSKFEGTGLGLSLSKNIMQKHNGFIVATGEEGVGASFYLYFPLEVLTP